MFDLEGKVAVVTGAASGIGLAVARRFSAAGVIMIMADISENPNEVPGLYIRADVGVEEEVRSLMTAAAEVNGRIDICVNNAGVTGGVASMTEINSADIERAFRVNTLGVMYGMKYAAPRMAHGSAIVNIASILGVIGYPQTGSYAASKFAVVGLTKVAALELGELGIRVNCVCPSSVNTPRLANHPNGEMEVAALGSMSGFHKLVEPEDVAAAVHFLVASDCGIISGQSLILDGGVTAGVSPRILEVTWNAYRASQTPVNND